jgi:hypothetical protein
MNYTALGTLAGLMLMAKPLLGRKPIMPSARGIIETAHMVPGRVRFVIPSMVGNARTAKVLEEQLASLDQIESLSINLVSGSVIIHYDMAAIEPVVLFGALSRLLGLDDQINNGKEPLVWREMKAAGQALDRAIYEKSSGLVDIKTLVTLVTLGTFTYKLVSDAGRLTSPGTVTLGWWFFNLIFMRGAI